MLGFLHKKHVSWQLKTKELSYECLLAIMLVVIMPLMFLLLFFFYLIEFYRSLIFRTKFLLAFLHIYAVLMPHFAAVAFCIKYNLVYEKVRNGKKKG